MVDNNCRTALYISLMETFSGQTPARIAMGLLPDTQNCELRMPRACRERFPAIAG